MTDVSWLNGRNQEILDRVIQLCNINSGTGNLAGIASVSELLIDWFGELGGEFRSIDLPPNQTVNSHGEIDQQSMGKALQFVKRSTTRPRILLCIHMDTVYQPTSPFQKCTMLDDGILNGPGVSDAKGGLMVMLYSLLALEQSPHAEKIGWEVIINPDEELGSPSSNEFLRQRAAEADWGMLFEPTLPDGTLVSWRKGAGNFVFVVRGKSAHSGREFEKGRNAIVAASLLNQAIHDLNIDPDVTYNVGRVGGGGALNMVPDLAISRINVRVKTREHQTIVLDNFKKVVEQVNALDGISCEMHGSFTSPPKQLDDRSRELQNRIERCGTALGLQVKWRGTGGASDGNKFAASNLPNIDTFGPRGGDIHSTNEYLIVESLEERAKLAAAVLMSFAEDQL